MKRIATLLLALTLIVIGFKSHAQSFDAGLTAGVVASQINGDGYWTMNGELVLGKDGRPLLASDASNVLFRSVIRNRLYSCIL